MMEVARDPGGNPAAPPRASSLQCETGAFDRCAPRRETLTPIYETMTNNWESAFPPAPAAVAQGPGRVSPGESPRGTVHHFEYPVSPVTNGNSNPHPHHRLNKQPSWPPAFPDTTENKLYIFQPGPGNGLGGRPPSPPHEQRTFVPSKNPKIVQQVQRHSGEESEWEYGRPNGGGAADNQEETNATPPSGRLKRAKEWVKKRKDSVVAFLGGKPKSS
ncbi:hypothetical protein V8F20_009581 [Naviculisporaceae sp. PSN 640]